MPIPLHPIGWNKCLLLPTITKSVQICPLTDPSFREINQIVWGQEMHILLKHLKSKSRVIHHFKSMFIQYNFLTSPASEFKIYYFKNILRMELHVFKSCFIRDHSIVDIKILNFCNLFHKISKLDIQELWASKESFTHFSYFDYSGEYN